MQGVRVVRDGRGDELRGTAAEVGDEANAQRVTRVQSFHRAQIAGHFGETLAETDAHEVHGQRVEIEIT